MWRNCLSEAASGVFVCFVYLITIHFSWSPLSNYTWCDNYLPLSQSKEGTVVKYHQGDEGQKSPVGQDVLDKPDPLRIWTILWFLVVLFSPAVFSIIQPCATFQLNMLCFTFNSAFYYIRGDLPSCEIRTDCFTILNPKYSPNDGLFNAVNVENYSVFSLIYFPFNLYSF